MIKLDLITGFLGAGKSMFITEYVKYLVARGQRVAVLVNDHGAINVDRLLLEEAVGNIAHIEMVIGGDADCTRRRRKTKLISLALGMGEIEDGVEQPVGHFDRVIVEPSGVYDCDEFFNLVYEEPLTKWYEVGNVITLFDADMERDISKETRYMLASQAANAGALLVTRAQDSEEKVEDSLDFVNACLAEFHCDRTLKNAYAYEHGQTEPIERAARCGYVGAGMDKYPDTFGEHFSSAFFFKAVVPEDVISERISALMLDKACGNILRLKGFQKHNDTYIMVNATRRETSIKQVNFGQEVYIVIGEELSTERIRSYIGGETYGDEKEILRGEKRTEAGNI